MSDAKNQEKDQYSTAGAYVHAGEEYTRDTTYIEDRVVADPETVELSERAQAWPVEAGRYRLVAARALISYGFHMKAERGQWRPFGSAQQIMATYHPSAVLRAVHEQQRQAIYQALLTDFRQAK